MEGSEGEAAGKCIGMRAMWAPASPVTLIGLTAEFLLLLLLLMFICLGKLMFAGG